MKIFKFLAIALVAMVGLNSCSKDCDHEFIEHDFTKDLVGTWTYFADNGQAEAMVINEDGSFTTTGVMKGGSLYEEKGTIKVVNNKVTLAYNSGDVFEGRLELVAGKSLSIVLFEEENIRLTYDYCEKPHSSTLASKIPWIEEPGGLQSMGSLRDRHDFTFTFMHWRRKWQPTPVLLLGESQGWGSLVGLPSMGSHRVGHD